MHVDETGLLGMKDGVGKSRRGGIAVVFSAVVHIPCCASGSFSLCSFNRRRRPMRVHPRDHVLVLQYLEVCRHVGILCLPSVSVGKDSKG